MPRLSLPALALAALLAGVGAPAPAAAQEVTGLSDWSLFLDPGHSRNQNVGFSGYSEARKVLRIGLALKEMLETRTDIGAVYISRTDDTAEVSLGQRTDAANAAGAAYFHSIHSNAAGPSANYAFVLWPQLISGAEPAAPLDGGRDMAETLGPALRDGMRIQIAGTNGGFGECDFYGASSCRSTNVTPKGSRNFVQSFSIMPSTLSEAGFHTNPVQNTRNMNAEWKRLEAQAMFWAILDYHGLARTPDRIATGLIEDAESGFALNGATIEIAGQSYTTDTYESLFNQYSNDPDELRNGFYYLEGLPAGTHAVTVTADDYAPFSGTVTMREGEFTFFDARLVSTVPPTVKDASPAAAPDRFPVTDPIVIAYSRPMDRPSTEAAFELSAGGAPVAGSFSWDDASTTLTFTPDADLAAQTEHALTVAGTALGQAGQPLDGDADGAGGDAYSLAFTTGFPDTTPPGIAGASPRPTTGDDLRPVVTVTYSERLLVSSLDGRLGVTRSQDAAPVDGAFQHAYIGDRSVISFFPAAALDPSTSYRFQAQPGIEDLFLNVRPAGQGFTFATEGTDADVTTVDDFEGDVDRNWWVPQQSGSTTGIVTDSTFAEPTDELALAFSGDTSLRIDYGWDESGPWLLREYLAGGEPRDVFFGDDVTLRAYVFGDGSGTLFRFAVDDNGPGGHEVSPWTPVDWFGWQAVDWDLDADGFGTWIGNGVFDGSLRFDSVQLSYGEGDAARFGQIWVDDLSLRAVRSVASEPGAPAAEALRLLPAVPNPVRDRAEVRFALGGAADVTAAVYSVTGAEVARLAAERPFVAGRHRLVWDASGVAAGVYVVRLTAAGQVQSGKLVVVR